MAATNINRVVITGNLTRDPELRSTPAAPRSAACASPSTAPQGRPDRRMGRQAQLLRRHRLGRPGRELRPATSSKGRPVAIDGRLEWREWEAKEGGSKRQAVDIIANSVQFLGSREGRRDGNGGFTPSSDVPADTSDFEQAPVAAGAAPTTTFRSDRRVEYAGHHAWRSSVVGTQTRAPQARAAPARARRGGGARSSRCPLYTRINSDAVDYKDLYLLRRFLSDKGKTRCRA